jgi:hypothetical protein
MHDWKQTVRRIRQIKLELSARCPGQGPALAPPPGADPSAIAVAERRLRRRLPPSYRAFLQEHDGWPLFFQGASLLGTRQLSRTSYGELTLSTFSAYDTTLAEIGASAWREGGAPLIPFGMDTMGSILFAFHPTIARRDGESEVIFWINGIGDRCASFAELLVLVEEMLAGELAEHQVDLRETA